MDFSYLTVLPRGRQIWDNVVFPPEAFAKRQAALEAALDEIGADGFMVYSDGLTRRYVSYLTNYCNSVSWSCSVSLILKGQDPIIISSMAPRDVPYNKRYLSPRLTLSAGGLSLLSNHHIGGKAVAYMKDNGLMDKKWAGVNLSAISAPGIRPIREAFEDIKDATAVFDRVLAVKDDQEIFAITQAAAMAKKAGLDYLRTAVTGVNERQAAARVDRALRVYGADNVALLVSAGKGPVMLRQPDDYEIQDGDTVCVHIVVMYLHYHAMFAAALYNGKPDEKRMAFYDSVRSRYEKAIHSIESGQALSRISAADETGYVLAQGIGADPAEAPYDDVRSGAVFSLTLCENSAEFGGVILSDTFAAGKNGMCSLGGAGAVVVAAR
jgi:Xaa-Pro aminopeptidase